MPGGGSGEIAMAHRIHHNLINLVSPDKPGFSEESLLLRNTWFISDNSSFLRKTRFIWRKTKFI